MTGSNAGNNTAPTTEGTKEPFRFHPDTIRELVAEECSTSEARVSLDRVERMKPYKELMDLRSSYDPATERGNMMYLVYRDGTMEELPNRTTVKSIFPRAVENALVIRYTSSRGDTFKVFMGRDLKDIAPKRPKLDLEDEEF